MASTPHARDSIHVPAASTIADWNPSITVAFPQAGGDTFCAACAAIIGPGGHPCPAFASSRTWHVPGHRAEQPAASAVFRIAQPSAQAARSHRSGFNRAIRSAARIAAAFLTSSESWKLR